MYHYKYMSVQISHQHIHTVCCGGEVKGLVASVHCHIAESAAIARVRVILNTNLFSILQTCIPTRWWSWSTCVCGSRVLYTVSVYKGLLMIINMNT